MTTASSRFRSMPSCPTLCSRMAASLPVSKRMRLPSYSTSAAYPQSFTSLGGVAECVVEHGDATHRLSGHGHADWCEPERERQKHGNRARPSELIHDSTSELSLDGVQVRLAI